MAATAPSTEDPYKVLGVDRDATVKEIKKAYRRIAFRQFPDRLNDADSMDLHRAGHSFQILSDPVSRATYDESTQSKLVNASAQADRA